MANWLHHKTKVSLFGLSALSTQTKKQKCQIDTFFGCIIKQKSGLKMNPDFKICCYIVKIKLINANTEIEKSPEIKNFRGFLHHH